jgi:hypothetical protein
LVKRRNFRPISEKLNWRGEEGGEEMKERAETERERKTKKEEKPRRTPLQPIRITRSFRIHAIFYYFCGYTR